ncbi:MAG: hypothetical protein LBQ44_04640 [Treponema sp.]|jgi:hypothetical protein|nr:hypothetical protein [Treponema sp.]
MNRLQELFNNLLILIPVAFFIVFRVIGALNKQARTPPRRSAETQALPPQRPAAGGEKAPARKAPKGSQTAYKPPEPVPAQEQEQRSPELAGPGDSPGRGRLEELQEKLSPLQMGMVWSEILGPPKA